MQRMLYRWEDRLFYNAALQSNLSYGGWRLYCSRIAGQLGDVVGTALHR
jgi:hypothetical protein